MIILILFYLYHYNVVNNFNLFIYFYLVVLLFHREYWFNSSKSYMFTYSDYCYMLTFW